VAWAGASNEGGLAVTIGRPRVLDRYEGTETDANLQTHHYCGLIGAGGDNLIATYNLRPDAPGYWVHDGLGVRRSTDSGYSFSSEQKLDYAGNKGGMLADGTVLLPSFYSWWVDEHQLRMVVQRSTDGGATWQQDSDVRVTFPAERRLGDVDADGHRLASMYFWGGILPLSGDRAVGTMYGTFADSTQWRSILISTDDGGHSWQFVSCIAGDKPSGHAGFTEPWVCQLPDGRLLAVMRTAYAEPRILAQCWSDDGGQTWTDPIAAPGIPGVGPEQRRYTTPDGRSVGFSAGNVSPALAVLDNGVLAMVYGRPGLKVALDAEGTGEHWDRIVELIPPAASYSWGTYDVTSGMAGLAAIAPDRLLVVYDVYLYADSENQRPTNTIFARPMTVQKIPR